MTRREVELLGLAILLLGCAATPPRALTAEACQFEPKPAVLIRNPEAPPAWVWVAEDQIPTSGRTLLFGKKGELAPPEVVAVHDPPPCGAPVSRLHAGVIEPQEPESPAWTFIGIVGNLLLLIGAALR
mgnify:FL=1